MAGRRCSRAFRGREQAVRHLLQFAPLGLLAGLALLLLPSAQAEPSYLVVFAGGAIAVCAWLLPAVSGSFILLTLGLYSAVITAIAELQLDILFSLALGCATGILFFAKALSWRVTGSLDTMVISWFFTSNVSTAMAIGLTEVATKTVLYYLHERAWNRIPLGTN